MRLNEMLNTFFNQNSASVKASGSAQQTQQLPGHIAAQIKALTPGQILQGEVLEYSGDTLKLLVNMNGENVTLQARLDQNVMLALGKSLLFQVKNNGSALSLSPLFENMGMEQNAAKALESASLPVNETTMSMTAKLMQEGISIDKNTLQEIYHEVISNQNAELMDIIDLHKLGMPVTEENLNQMHAYKGMTHQLTGGIEQMAQDLQQLVQHMVENDQEKDVGAFLKAILQPGGEMSALQEQSALQPQKMVLTEAGVLQEAANIGGEGAAAQTMNQIPGKLSAETLVQTDALSQNTIAAKEMSPEQLLKEIFNQLESTMGDKAALSKLVQSDIFKANINEFLQKQLMLEPESADKKQVQEMYQRLGKQLSAISEALTHVGQEQSSLGKTVQNMSQNVQFLNQMNSMYAYVQLPLKLSENNAHGELYVYSNKKHLAEKDGEVSALLHLDMDNLGPLDVYVKQKETKVNTEFFLQDEDMLDFLYEHMDLLTERLNKRGYQMTYKMTVRNEQEDNGDSTNTTFRELINENSNIPMMVNYSFDVRA
ncbi:MAG: flagellar hook-length control protein FliK [Lachnospiraceae bacterium]|nr:flagellar hook-length control protein FliK [Lachnospiraceae bacterium]